MSKKLTEDMVISRTKISDLSKVKRLNCWGSELEDVSLLRLMPFVEVLSLSINKIHSLVDFQFCKRLEELYIRQNDIQDVNEVMYLQNLSNLKNLWLDENPCAHVDGYRLAVIKALPQLQKLDNVTITREEFQESQWRGKTLYLPHEIPDESKEEYALSTPPKQYQRYQNYTSECMPPLPSPQRQEGTECDIEESEDLYPREDVSEDSRDYSPLEQASPPQKEVIRSYTPETEFIDRRNSYGNESQNEQYERETSRPQCERESPRKQYERESPRQQYYEEYANGEIYISSHHFNENTAPPVQDRKEKYTCPATSHRPPFNRRPVTRNSNILSAVLCLVKELDYPSLEVVEMAVRCRMDELDE